MAAIDPQDRWLIWNTAKSKALESHPTKARADYWCRSLNEHEIQNGRRPVYTVRERSL